MSPPHPVIEATLGAPVLDTQSIAGGDANRALKVTLGDGRRVFIKYRRGARRDLYEAEADGLEWLRSADAIYVPAVLGLGPADHPFLALEWLDTAPASLDDHASFGESLAALHAAGAEQFGYRRDNYIGVLSQENGSLASWPEFYGQRRVAPMARRAAMAGGISESILHPLDRLIDRFDEVLASDEAPSRLHGDLWSGNALFLEDGRPAVLDPAVYAGHREVDLAMMRMFGGFDDRAFEAYDAAAPLEAGWQERVPLYQLYPLLVHAVMFGGGYGSSVEAILTRYAK